MRRWLRKKIDHWRSQPEHVRVRLATRLTWGSGAALIILWLAILLPFQLYIARDDSTSPAVQGTSTASVPPKTPSPSPSATTPN